MALHLPSSWKVIAFTVFLLSGLALSQVVGIAMEAEAFQTWIEVVTALTMWALSFIMINVGYEFTFDKGDLATYAWDYLIAMTAAGFPWLFVAVWYMVLITGVKVDEAFLVARFAAPTSAGILFSMLEAAGLRETWVFQKARILAIFDDLDTILLMIPLKVIMIGFKWELGVTIAVMAILLVVAWCKLHAVKIPHSWKWTLLYALIIAAVCKVIHYVTHHYIDMEPIHIEVLLPAFVMGCVVDTPCAREELKLQKASTLEKKAKMQSIASNGSDQNMSKVSISDTVSTDCGSDDKQVQYVNDLKQTANVAADKHSADCKTMQPIIDDACNPPQVHEAWTANGLRPVKETRRNSSKNSTSSKYSGGSGGSQESRLSRHGIPKQELEVVHDDLHAEDRWEHIACTTISMVFMVLVGLSMPPLIGERKTGGGGGHRRLASSGGATEAAVGEEMAPELIVAHVLAVSFLMVVGKMFPIVCYRDEATLKERFALCIGMCPRGEVGASIIVISLELGVQGPAVIISMCALVINLVLSGGFIGMVKCLIRSTEKNSKAIAATLTIVEELPKIGEPEIEEC